MSEAFCVINCLPDQGDLRNRMLSEIMKLKDPTQEARCVGVGNANNITSSIFAFNNF